MDYYGGSVASDLSPYELLEEYSSRPLQIADWLWCIEYVANHVKDLQCILELMNMGNQYSDDHGRRMNEILSLRVLEFLFDPSKNVSTSKERVEFDLSLSNGDVLKAIMKEIPVSEFRVGMPELSKFNVLPFIAYKNMCLLQSAVEKTNTGPCIETNVPVLRENISIHMDTREEELIDERQVHIGNTTSETFPSSSRRWLEDSRVKCASDGTWLISGCDDDESDMVKDPALNTNLLPRNVCWKCRKDGTLLICSRSECTSTVHKECLSYIDEDGKCHCSMCCYDLVVEDYLNFHKLLSSAKRNLVRFMPLLSTRSKRLRVSDSD